MKQEQLGTKYTKYMFYKLQWTRQEININQHGLIIADIGATYQADHILKDGTIPESSLDHVYTSSSIQKLLKVKKLVNSSTDHIPVVINLDLDIKEDKSKMFSCIISTNVRTYHML